MPARVIASPRGIASPRTIASLRGWASARGFTGVQEQDPFADFLVADDFIDLDSTTLPNHAPDKDTVGSGWTDADVGITIESNKASDNDVRGAAVIDAGDADVEIEATIVIQSGGNGFNGFVFRYQDSTHFFIGGLDNLLNKIVIWENDAGFSEKLGNANGSFPLSDGETHTLKITMNGTAIEIFINGGSEGSIVNSKFQTETEHGLYADAVGGGTDITWDNFRIGAL